MLTTIPINQFRQQNFNTFRIHFFDDRLTFVQSFYFFAATITSTGYGDYSVFATRKKFNQRKLEKSSKKKKTQNIVFPMLQHLFFQFLNFLIICIFFKFGRFHDGVRAGKLTTEWDVAAGILFIVCGIGLLSALIAVFIDYMSFLTTMRRRNVKDSKQLIKYFFV